MSDRKNRETRDEQDEDKKNAGPRAPMVWLFIILAMTFVFFLTSQNPGSFQSQLTLDDTLTLIRKDCFQLVVFEEGRATFHLREGSTSLRQAIETNLRGHLESKDFPEDNHPIEMSLSSDWAKRVTDTIVEHNTDYQQKQGDRYKPTRYVMHRSLWLDIILTTMPWVVILLLFYFFFWRRLSNPGNGVLSFGRSRAKVASKEKTNITFNDVAGCDEVKEEVQEVVEFLKYPERFTRMGGKIPRGILLVGAPGTGKTLLAKAIAGEASVPFYSISGSDFVEMFVGVGAARVRDLFAQAKETAPCIIFLDEIDAVGRRRGSGLSSSHDEREQTLNAILVEMDGFETTTGIIMIAATNRPDVLDPALLRPGRFDRHVVVDLPDVKGRAAILKVHAKNVKLSEHVQLSEIARGTPGFSGAELANLINEGTLLAVLQNKNEVEMSDLWEARDKITFGKEKRSRVIPERARRLTAYHEAGHAIVSIQIEADNPLHKVSIIPRGMALGMTMSLPSEDSFHKTKEGIIKDIVCCFGGRAAEEIFLNDITPGASNDIKQASEMARKMVCEWGMSEKIGMVNYTQSEERIFLGGEMIRHANHSDQVGYEIDVEVKKLLDDAYARAREILKGHREEVELLTVALLEYETLDGQEVRQVIKGETLNRQKRNGDTPPTPPATAEVPTTSDTGTPVATTPPTPPEKGLDTVG